MINEIDILHESHRGDFTGHPGEESAGLFCVVSYHHKVIVELGEYGFNPFAELFVGPRRRPPVLLIEPVWHFKRDVCHLKEILLDFGAEISFVTEHHTVVVFPTHILEIMEVMHSCGSHVIGVYDSSFSTDSMEFISIIMQSLRCTIPPVRGGVDIVAPHCAAFCPCVLTHLYGFGINAEHVLGTINGDSHILADFLCKTGRQFTPDIELPTADKVRQSILAFIVQTMEQEILAVKAKCFGGYSQSNDFEVGELGNNPASRYIAEFIYSISGRATASESIVFKKSS